MNLQLGTHRLLAGRFMLMAAVLGTAAIALAVVLAVRGSGDVRGEDDPAFASATFADGPALTTSATIEFWRARLAADPTNFVAANRLADVYLRRARQTGDVSDYGRAEAALQASLEAYSYDNYAALAQLAYVQTSLHDFAAALETANAAIELRPGKPYAYGVRGDALLALGRYDEALADFNRLVIEAPGVASFSRIAFLLELHGEIEQAAFNWDTAVSIDSGRRVEDSAWVRSQRGHFLLRQGDVGAAEAAFEDALDALPGYVDAEAGLAEVAARRGDLDSAIARYEAVTRRLPTPAYLVGLLDAYEAAGRDDAAAQQRALVESVIALYEENGVRSDLQLAAFRADYGEPAGALQLALAAYEARPSIQAADVLGWAYYRNGDYEQALSYSEEARRLGTRDPVMLYHAGMIYEALGDAVTARTLIGQALDVDRRFSLRYAASAADTLDELDHALAARSGS